MNSSIKNLLKQYLTNKEYDTYNDILIKEIIYSFVRKIKKREPQFLYSSLVELLEISDKYLEKKDIEILKSFYDLVKTNYQPEFLSEELMEIYIKTNY